MLRNVFFAVEFALFLHVNFKYDCSFVTFSAFVSNIVLDFDWFMNYNMIRFSVKLIDWLCLKFGMN